MTGNKNKIYLATAIDRLWHWVHALGIVALILTGFNIHFVKEFNIFGSMEQAVRLHNIIGLVVTFDFGLWFIYNLVTFRIKYYLPNREDVPVGMFKQALYYGYGIFAGKPHPFHTDESRKFNPLQKLTYLGIMTALVPFQIVTGLYLLAMVSGWTPIIDSRMMFLSIAHTIVAFFATAFLIGHVYLATTGKKPHSLFVFMITGWHDREH